MFSKFSTMSMIILKEDILKMLVHRIKQTSVFDASGGRLGILPLFL